MSDAQDEYAALLSWMKSKGPRERHQIATTWNWDAGYDILTWIIEQKDTDLGTAVSLFYLGSADYFMKFSNREDVLAKEPWAIENFDFLSRLVQLVSNSEYYSKAEFSSAWVASSGEIKRYMEAEKAVPALMRPWSAPARLLAPVSGEDVDIDGFAEGFPPHIQEQFW